VWSLGPRTLTVYHRIRAHFEQNLYARRVVFRSEDTYEFITEFVHFLRQIRMHDVWSLGPRALTVYHRIRAHLSQNPYARRVVFRSEGTNGYITEFVNLCANPYARRGL